MVSLRAPEGVQGQQSAAVVGLPHCLFLLSVREKPKEARGRGEFKELCTLLAGM